MVSHKFLFLISLSDGVMNYVCNSEAAPAAAKWGGRDIWGSGGEAHGKFFGATPFKTLGNAHFEDRNTPF